MRRQINPSESQWPPDATLKNAILVLSGYGLDIRVWRGRLRVEDGFGRDRRELILHRATSGLKRLVVIGHTGSITLDAIRWLNDIGASYIQLDADGRLLAAFGGAAHEQPRLRRAQARAIGERGGVDVTRWLIARKLEGQLASLALVEGHAGAAGGAADAIAASVRSLAQARDGDELRAAESFAAIAYWSAWSTVPVQFAARDAATVPPHWLKFGPRASALTGQPRSATNPANAMLNYLYAVVESEATIAARAVGLDPGVGLFHLDARYRQSLAADLMEPVRPLVDRYLLDTIAERTFAANDFFETRTGVCRLTPPLAKELAATAMHWRPLVGRVAEDVALALLDAPPWEPTARPITSARRTSRAAQTKPDGRTSLRSIQPRCHECGKPVARRRDRTCSPECERLARKRAGYAGAAKSLIARAERRAAGIDPTRTPEARAKRSASCAARCAEQRAWEQMNPHRPDGSVYESEIAPGLKSVSIKQIMKATGLSTAQAWRIRDGRIVPHPRWWEALRVLAFRPRRSP